MLQKKSVVIGVGIALALGVLIFEKHAIGISSSDQAGSITMAFPLNPSQGWDEAGQAIPNIVKIYGLMGSGGSTAWAEGVSASGATQFSVYAGNNWQTVSAPSTVINMGNTMVAAYPETGAQPNAWVAWGAGNNAVAYFNGSSFGPVDTTTFMQKAATFYSSQGVGWALVTSTFQSPTLLGVSTFNTTNATANSWSPIKALPANTNVYTNFNGFTNYNAAHNSQAVATSQGMLYILAANASGQPELITVDKNNNVSTQVISIMQAPLNNQAMIFVQGNALMILTPTQTGFLSYYSANNGQTWANISNELPAQINGMGQQNLQFANGVVAIPPGISGQSVASNGYVIDLKQSTPAWVSYPFPTGVTPNGSFNNNAHNLSMDGSEGCVFTGTSAGYACYDFTQKQWFNTGTTNAPPGNLQFIDEFVPLGNHKIAVVNGNMTYFYDSSNWIAAPITGQLGFPPYPPSLPSSYSPNALWWWQ